MKCKSHFAINSIDELKEETTQKLSREFTIFTILSDCVLQVIDFVVTLSFRNGPPQLEIVLVYFRWTSVWIHIIYGSFTLEYEYYLWYNAFAAYSEHCKFFLYVFELCNIMHVCIHECFKHVLRKPKNLFGIDIGYNIFI